MIQPELLPRVKNVDLPNWEDRPVNALSLRFNDGQEPIADALVSLGVDQGDLPNWTVYSDRPAIHSVPVPTKTIVLDPGLAFEYRNPTSDDDFVKYMASYAILEQLANGVAKSTILDPNKLRLARRHAGLGGSLVTIGTMLSAAALTSEISSPGSLEEYGLLVGAIIGSFAVGNLTTQQLISPDRFAKVTMKRLGQEEVGRLATGIERVLQPVYNH